MRSPKRAEAFNSESFLTVPLRHTWPIWERSRHFELGHILNAVITDLVEPPEIGQMGLQHAGCWECTLSDNSLVWSGGVYDLFGLPRGASISREQAVAYYSEDSRAKMERLRAYAIRHRRGFTLDVEIHAAVGDRRWMRLIAEPVSFDGRLSCLHGLKLVI